MTEHQQKMEEVQAEIKQSMEDRVVKTVKEVQEDKEKFEATCVNVDDLSSQIKTYMQKFEDMKNEITESGKKFKAYHEDIETRKLKIELLEQQIENAKLVGARSNKVDQEIKEERERMKKQMETLNGLKEALSFKINNAKK